MGKWQSNEENKKQKCKFTHTQTMSDEKTKPVNVPLFGLTINLSFRDKDGARARVRVSKQTVRLFLGQKEKNQPASKAILSSHFHCE